MLFKKGVLGNKSYYRSKYKFDIQLVMKRIYQVRVSKNIKQEALAKDAGVSQGLISQIENGSIKKTEISILEKIRNSLKVSLVDFYADEKIVEVKKGLKSMEKKRKDFLYNGDFVSSSEIGKDIEDVEMFIGKYSDYIKVGISLEKLRYSLNVELPQSKKHIIDINKKTLNYFAEAETEYEKISYLNVIMEEMVGILPRPIMHEGNLVPDIPIFGVEGVLGFQYVYPNTIFLDCDFIVKVKDDSLNIKGIYEGELVLIQGFEEYNIGDIVYVSGYNVNASYMQCSSDDSVNQGECAPQAWFEIYGGNQGENNNNIIGKVIGSQRCFK